MENRLASLLLPVLLFCGAAQGADLIREARIASQIQEALLPGLISKMKDELELAVARLRDSKENLGEDEYYRRLENLMIELAKLYSEQAERR